MKPCITSNRNNDENFSCLIEKKRGEKQTLCVSAVSRPSAAGLSEPWVRCALDLAASVNPRPGCRLCPSKQYCPPPDFKSFLRPCAALVPSLLAVDSSWWCTHKQYGLGNYDENQKDTSNFGRLERAHELAAWLLTLFKSVRYMPNLRAKN